MRRPLGCFSFSALAAAVVAVLAIIGGAAVSGNGIFSPGELSRVAHGGPVGGVSSHAELAGRCEACHASIGSAKGMGSLCLACHTDVAQTIATKTGLHGRLNATADTCRTCHTDHRGSSAPLTLANPNVFPHEQTGFSLVSHQHASTTGGLTCRDCHSEPTAAYTKPDCVSCHQARNMTFMAGHKAAFGTGCLKCHDGVETLGAAFRHTSYALTGAHTSAQCVGCHQDQTTPAALKTTRTDCVACHQSKDIHAGRLGTACAECHTTTDWTGAQIDHSRTTFALVGKHVGTACESCHTQRQWTGLGTTCASCHAKDDPHAGQFGTDCASCHTAATWKGATFDHSTTSFALVGAHTTTACTACHAGGVYKGTPSTCESCHARPATHSGSLGGACTSCHTSIAWKPATFNHTTAAFPLSGAHLGVTCQKCHTGGSFASAPTTCVACHARPANHSGTLGGACASCHTTIAWLPATFNHNNAAFKLTGSHVSISCTKCHAGGVYKGTPTACASCHTKPASHDAAYGTACASCHTTKAWLPSTFNHSAAYKLTGAHMSVTCQQCHPGGVTKGAPTTCVGCHTKPASHDAGYGTACASCHTTTAWLPATFNHDNAAFKLTGAHVSINCTKCHVGGVYKGTPTACSSCHTKPASHTASYGSICSSCHTTKAWLPATYNGVHTFPQTHGGAASNCTACHPSGPPAYSCAQCHSNASMTSKHSGVTNFSLTTCAACHPTGTVGG